MATYTFHVPFDTLGTVPLESLADVEIYSTTATEIRAGLGGVTLVVLQGSFLLDPDGEAIGGTLTGWRTFVAPEGVALETEVGGLSIDLFALVEWVLSGDETALLNAFFGGDDVFTGSYGADVLASYAGNDLLRGGQGNDTLLGDQGSDTLEGGTGADSMEGGEGNDTLDGGAGIDTLVGGNGSDVYTVAQGGDRVVEVTAGRAGGTDTVLSWRVNYTLDDNVENGVVMSPGAANLSGNGLANILTSGPGANRLAGGAGIDTASYANATVGVRVSLAIEGAQGTGGAGSDTLIDIESLLGSAFADRLSGNDLANLLTGGDGDDVLSGGGGNDTLVGNAGRDTFRFASTPDAATNVDIVRGFVPADDRVTLENAVFTALGNEGALPSGMFRASLTARPLDASDRLLYETDTGKLFYDADGSGEGAAVLIATLTDAPMLTASDIFVT